MEPAPVPVDRLVGRFNFRVALRRAGAAPAAAGPSGSTSANPAAAPPADALGDGAFQSCSGLELEMEAHEHLEGGRNDGVVRLPGRGRFGNIVLKRGMLLPPQGSARGDLWRWLQDTIATRSPVVRYDGTITVLDGPQGRTVATWTFRRGLPVRIKGPELDAVSGDIAVEELHIAHEGLRMEIPR